MNDDVVLRVEGLGKRYRLGQTIDLKRTFREMLTAMPRNLGSKAKRGITTVARSKRQQEQWEDPETPPGTFWALRDINFELQRGEVLGIIGRNGAGKSTLLKVLSRITSPTTGHAEIHGRVSSLLEVGTGFHPELTGRENIYLNGAILGMHKPEIDSKFDAIVAFAEVEEFIDTPVKRYSSGMYVRLAFAVAAHLEPEIMIVDEVLAVGDAGFQRKCLGKMGEVAHGGRTVLFVSHNMGAVNQLCGKGILLEKGRIEKSGDVRDVTNAYLHTNQQQSAYVNLDNVERRSGNGTFRVRSIVLLNSKRRECQAFSIGEDVTFLINLELLQKVKKVKLALQIRTSDGIPLCNMVDSDSGFELTEPKEVESVSITMKDIRLYPDSYYLSIWVGDPTSNDVYDYVEDCAVFNIIDGGLLTMRRLPRQSGLFFWTPEWKRE